jgi:hypothetical protein
MRGIYKVRRLRHPGDSTFFGLNFVVISHRFERML